MIALAGHDGWDVCITLTKYAVMLSDEVFLSQSNSLMIVVDIFIKSRLSLAHHCWLITRLYMAVMFVGFWFWLPSSSSIQCQLYALLQVSPDGP